MSTDFCHFSPPHWLPQFHFLHLKRSTHPPVTIHQEPQQYCSCSDSPLLHLSSWPRMVSAIRGDSWPKLEARCRQCFHCRENISISFLQKKQTRYLHLDSKKRILNITSVDIVEFIRIHFGQRFVSGIILLHLASTSGKHLNDAEDDLSNLQASNQVFRQQQPLSSTNTKFAFHITRRNLCIIFRETKYFPHKPNKETNEATDVVNSPLGYKE